MVRIEEHKRQTEDKAIERIALPLKAYIPLAQHLGKACIPVVEVGASVFTGQMIARVDAHIWSPVHASISGRVASIEDWPHPVLGRAKAIVIESDGLDNRQPSAVSRQPEEVNKLTAEQIRGIVLDAGIVGMGGASFPTHVKLSPPKPVDSLIINGAECEPYLTSDYRLMLEKTKEIIRGIDLAVKCLGVKNIYIAIEDNKPEAIKMFRKELAVSGAAGFKVRVLKSKYPQGGEKQLIKEVLKRQVPPGKVPFEIGAVVHNVATLYAIYEAVYLGKPLYERVVTVTGDCLNKSGNFLVRIGTMFKDLTAHCGLFKREPKEVICGGPMMGIAQYTLDTPVTKSTNGIIFFSQSSSEPELEPVCIRCSRCVQHCPLGLMPCLITSASDKQKWDLAKLYGSFDCMECGLCNYVCPQKINLLQKIKYSKLMVPK